MSKFKTGDEIFIGKIKYTLVTEIPLSEPAWYVVETENPLAKFVVKLESMFTPNE